MAKSKVTKTRKKLLAGLKTIVGRENVYNTPTYLLLYTYDASLERGQPDFVVFPDNTVQVSQIVQLAERYHIPYLPRGAGTNLSGGAVPSRGGIVMALSRLNRILEIDVVNRRAVVQPGVVNLHLQNALAKVGFFYAPDPASQKVSTIGGNVGENAGGPHCLKYGLTFNHVLGLTTVLPGGRVVTLGAKAYDEPGFDLVGLLVGSEGTLGILTEIVVRIVPLPESCVTLLAIYDSLDNAAKSVSQIMATGIIPAALELMDRPVIQAVEDSYRSGFPREAEAVLIIEIDGLRDSLASQGELIRSICQNNGVVRIEQASSSIEREKLWAGRKGAFGAIARLRPSYMVNDGTVPRTKLPEVLMKIGEISRRYSILIGNVAHAGDGNLHPVILFDERDEEEKQRVIEAGSDILRVCAEAGGTISGEHGIGLEKKREMGFIFSDRDMKPMRWIKEAFDINGLCNPDKIFPAEGPCLSGAPSKDEITALESQEGQLSHQSYDTGSSGGLSIVATGVTPSDLKSLQGVLKWAQDTKRAVNITGKAIPDQAASLPCAERKAEGIGDKSEVDEKTRPGSTPLMTERHQPGSKECKSKSPITLSLASLNRILEFDPENFYISLQAGIDCRSLEQLLDKHKLFLPFDPPFPETDTVGGCLAKNYRGLRSAGYGTPRDWVLGLTAMLPGLGSFKCGGRTVKNVSGYDLVRLLVGAHGTLGVITEATLRLFPRPESSSTFTFNFGSFSAAIEFGRELLNHKLLTPSSLLCHLPCTEKKKGSGDVPSRGYNLPGLFLILEGQKSDIQRQLIEIEQIRKDFRDLDTGIPVTIKQWEKEEEKSVWNAWKRTLPDYLNTHASEEWCFLVKAGCLVVDLEETIREIVKLINNHSFGCCVLADLPAGIAWIAISCGTGEALEIKKRVPDQEKYFDLSTSLTAFQEEMHKLILPQTRFITIQPWRVTDGQINSRVPFDLPHIPTFQWVPSDKLELMTRIKSRFDPDWLLNPDRFP